MIAPIKYERRCWKDLNADQINEKLKELIQNGEQLIHYQEELVPYGSLGEDTYDIIVVIAKFQENIL